MPKQTNRTGAKKSGRPKIDARLGRAVRFYRSAGFSDEIILGAIAPHLLPPANMATRERSRRVRQTLNRWERKAGIAAMPVNRERENALQNLAYATRQVRGWTASDDDTAADLEVKAQHMAAQIAEIEAAKRAGALTVPMTRDDDGGASLLQAKIAEIGERVESLREADRRERQRIARLRWGDGSGASLAERVRAWRENGRRHPTTADYRETSVTDSYEPGPAFTVTPDPIGLDAVYETPDYAADEPLTRSVLADGERELAESAIGLDISREPGTKDALRRLERPVPILPVSLQTQSWTHTSMGEPTDDDLGDGESIGNLSGYTFGPGGVPAIRGEKTPGPWSNSEPQERAEAKLLREVVGGLDVQDIEVMDDDALEQLRAKLLAAGFGPGQ